MVIPRKIDASTLLRWVRVALTLAITSSAIDVSPEWICQGCHPALAFQIIGVPTVSISFDCE
jgi:hypothetical protein